MSDLIADRIAELHRINDGGEPDALPVPVPAVEPAPTPAASAAPPGAADQAAPSVPRVLSLDDLLPDDFETPSLRGQPVRALVQDRKDAIKRRDDDGKVKNDYESRAVVLENLLAMMIDKQQKPAAPAPAEPARAETAEERIRREQLDAIMAADPALALGRAVEIAQESIDPKIKGQTDPLNARLENLEKLERNRAINAAYDQAGKLLKRDAATWRSDTEIQRVSRVVEYLRLPQDNPQSYVQATEWLGSLVADLGLQSAPATAASAAPIAPAPTAPPPPVGSGEPAAPTETTKPSLSGRDADISARVAKHFGLDKAKTDELAARVMNQRHRQAAAR